MENSLLNDFKIIDDLCNECVDYLNLNTVEINSDNITEVEPVEMNIINSKHNRDHTVQIVLDDFDNDEKSEISKNNVIETNLMTHPDNIKYMDDFESVSCKTLNEAGIDAEKESEHNVNCRDIRSERMRKFSQQLPKIIITSTDGRRFDHKFAEKRSRDKWIKIPHSKSKRRIRKDGNENVALISNIPFEKMRLLNDTFHTLINLRWRWIILGTVLVHFGIWFVFAVFWYIAALSHDDFDPVNPPKHRCITGGTDFLNIFLASVEAQTTIGFGDRTIDEECPESIFLFIMQLIMGTGLSGVLTCVVYAKLTRPENFAKEGVGFSKNAAVSLMDGQLCLMFRAWDLNYDHIIGSEINVFFIRTLRTKEGEVLKHYAQSLKILQQQLMLWPITVTHVIDSSSPLYDMDPEDFLNSQYEITVSLKGASASMGTYTQSQTSYLPREVLWGGRFPSVIKYSSHEQKYVIDKNLDTVEDVDTPLCSARRLDAQAAQAAEAAQAERGSQGSSPSSRPATPTSFTEQVELFTRSRTSSFRRKNESNA